MLRFQEDVDSRYELLEFSSLVIEDAVRLLTEFGKDNSLKTLDSLQFAFFTTHADEDDVLVCSDDKLVAVARLDGCEVLVPIGSI